MTDDKKKIQLAIAVSSAVQDTCIKLKIQPYDAVEVMAKAMMILAFSSSREGREADVVLDIVGMIWELGTDMTEAKRGEGDNASSVQRNH